MKIDDNLVLGLDIGSTKICAAICEIDRYSDLSLKGIGHSISSGIHKGKIEDPRELLRSIERAIRRAQMSAGASSAKVFLNCPFAGIGFAYNSGIVMGKEENGIIILSDKTECINRSKTVVKTGEQTIMHAIPLFYKVDQKMVQNPVGMVGKNLEVYTHLVLGNTDNITILTKLIRQLNLQVKGLIYDPLAMAQVYLSDLDRRDGSLLLDIGGRFSKLNVFKNNLLQKSLVIPIGGETITADIAACLKVTVPEAERLKILYGTLDISSIGQHETIEITSKETGRTDIKKMLLCQIIEARVSELLKIAKKQIKFDFGKTYPLVLAGNGSQLKGLQPYLLQNLGLPVREHIPETMRNIIESPSHASAIGLVLYGVKNQAVGFVDQQKKTWLGKMIDWFLPSSS